MNDPRNAELEARIAKDPDDDAAWQIYADWLSEQGSARGELAALQIAYAKKRLPRLRKKAEALIAKEKALFLGRDAADIESLKWRAGFWKHAVIRDTFDALAAPSARLCQAFTFVGSIDDYTPAIDALKKHGPFPALRKLTIGEESELSQADFESYLDVRSCRGLAALSAIAPNLRSLHLRLIEDFDFGSFPKLRSLRVASVTPKPESLRMLFAQSLPRLRRLALDVGTLNNDAENQTLAASDFAALGEGMPRLAKLELHAFSDVDTLAADLDALLAPLKMRLASCVIDGDVSM